MEWFGVKEKEGTFAMQTFLHLHGMVFLAFVWLLMLAMIRTYQKLGDCIYLRIFSKQKTTKKNFIKCNFVSVFLGIDFGGWPVFLDESPPQKITHLCSTILANCCFGMPLSNKGDPRNPNHRACKPSNEPSAKKNHIPKILQIWQISDPI